MDHISSSESPLATVPLYTRTCCAPAGSHAMTTSGTAITGVIVMTGTCELSNASPPQASNPARSGSKRVARPGKRGIFMTET